MTPEEKQRIKEHEKERLRARRALRETERQQSKRASIARALADITAALGPDAHVETIGRLRQETALNEARLEVALERAAPKVATSDAVELPSEEPKRIEKTIGRRR